MGVYKLPILNPPPTSHLISSLWIIPMHQPQASCILYRRDWHFVSYMIVYMFQCHSPKSSHPLPLPQSPKAHSIHLCLLCCLAYRVIITIFLNSIYMCQYTVLVETISKVKRQPSEWEKTIANEATDKQLISKI